MTPGPDNEATALAVGLVLLEEMAQCPDLELLAVARHFPWGSEIDVSYPGTWRRLWRRQKATLLITHDGRVIKLTYQTHQVPL